jgi:FkbM family methyltransferase
MTTEAASEGTADRLGRLASHLDRPLVVIDVGCRDGDAAGWKTFGSGVHVIGFEPDVEECERLQESYDGPAKRTFVPLALGGKSDEATLHVTRFPQSSSLFEPSTEAIERHPALTAHEEIGRRTVDLTTLDEWMAAADAPAPDFMKLDIQGAELDVLRSSPRALESIRALEVEVSFKPLYRGQPLFADVNTYMAEQGFVLWRLRDLRHLAIAGAAPEGLVMSQSVMADEAEMQPGGGQLSWGEAIFVRHDFAAPAEESWSVSLRDACVAVAIGLPELAQLGLKAAIAANPRAAAVEDLERALEILTTEGRGRPEQAFTVGMHQVIPPGYADPDTVGQLIFERDEARSEVYQLRDQVQDLGRLIPATRKARAARRRARSWSVPRIGVLRQYPPVELRIPRRQFYLRAPRNAPTIALVTPSYSQGEFIERTIRSVLGQSYPALEYVVQDGGSADSTLDVLDRYRDRLTAAVSEPDEGQADAINRGFSRTGGEIMGWLNSDDVLLPGALAAVARHFAKHPETDLVYGHRAMIDENDRQVGAWIVPPHEDWPLDLADYVPQETMFWRRGLWERVGGRLDPTYEYALDWELLLRFKDAGARMVRLPYVMGGFRLHVDQKTTALISVGMTDTDRLMAERGSPPVYEDRLKLLQPYLRRHLVSHTAHRLLARAPGFTAPVEIPRSGR